MKIANYGLGEDDEMGYQKVEYFNDEATARLKAHYKDIIATIDDEPEREGLINTPERVAKSMQFLTQGYKLEPSELLKSAMFKEEYSQMVLVKDIEIYSLCEHHMLPFLAGLM